MITVSQVTCKEAFTLGAQVQYSLGVNVNTTFFEVPKYSICWTLIGSLINDDGDGNENGKKQ